MSLRRAPRFDAAGAERLARDRYGFTVAAVPLPSERDQNFLVTTPAGERFVLKIANGLEDRAMLEAQNEAMAHVATRVDFCPRIVAAISGDTIALTPDRDHFVRLVTYLAGTPLAKIATRDGAFLEKLGRAIGRLDAALADFDHAAIHRDFHWDLANAGRVIDQYLPLVDDTARRLIQQVSAPALAAIDEVRGQLRRSAVHHDANDWNVLVSTDSARGGDISGIIDFGDMVYSWTVADPAVAAAYAMLDRPNPIETVTALARGYQLEYALRDEELNALFPLAALRLCMSACIAAWQQRQRPEDEYLAVSQEPIRRLLPALTVIDWGAAAQAVRGAVR
jgi:Ser/Thr protein kinase RdoA (MazF antagonist)